jgi:hypothetical protein
MKQVENPKNKYDEKYKIDAPFDEAMDKILKFNPSKEFKKPPKQKKS